MHYTNPTGISDIIDSSGLSIGLTSTLRPNDAGIMPLGPYMYDLQIIVPPKMVRSAEMGAPGPETVH